MKYPSLLLMLLLAFGSAVGIADAAEPEQEAGTPSLSWLVCQKVIPEYELSAANLYEAVNRTLREALKSDPRVADLEIVIGPMAPRSIEEVRKLSLKNAKLMDILRCWAELYQFAMHFDKQRIVFDGKPPDNYREEEELRRKLHLSGQQRDK